MTNMICYRKKRFTHQLNICLLSENRMFWTLKSTSEHVTHKAAIYLTNQHMVYNHRRLFPKNRTSTFTRTCISTTKPGKKQKEEVMATMSRATTLAASANALFTPTSSAAASRAPHLATPFLDRSFKLRQGLVAVKETRREARAMDGFLRILGFGARGTREYDPADVAIAQGPDEDRPAAGQQFACFGAGCFWGVELAYQRVPGVTKTEVGYTQGQMHMPTYEAVCSGQTGHSEVVRVEYNPAEVSYENLLNVFWDRHDPTTLNRQGGDVGTQYRSGIYFYTPEQEKAAKESLENHQKSLNRKIVTEILPAKKFYRAESYHQQYLAKGGRMGLRQSPEKGCKDPIRCYG